ncbi:MAG: hypothetical protein HUU20_05780 [Pirellulales bacterium]|nr:hypothetical protein [Pirellulales bacterium]
MQMPLYASAARYRLGQLLDNVEGNGLFHGAEADLIERGIVNPDRLVGMLAPGFSG